jgi:hypothetical protein
VDSLKEILAKIEKLPAGVLSITGFSEAFASPVNIWDTMYVINYSRDRLVANSLRQIWWITPDFSHLSLYGMPDIHSYFTAKLQLTEDRSTEEERRNTNDIIRTNIDKAFRDAQTFYRIRRAAQETGMDR